MSTQQTLSLPTSHFAGRAAALLAAALLALAAGGARADEERDWDDFVRHVRTVYYQSMENLEIARHEGVSLEEIPEARVAFLRPEIAAKLLRDERLAVRVYAYALGQQLANVEKGTPEHARWLALERRFQARLDASAAVVARETWPSPTPEQVAATREGLRNLALLAMQGRADLELARLTGVGPGEAPDFFALKPADLLGEWEFGELDRGMELPIGAYRFTMDSSIHGFVAEHAEEAEAPRSWKLVRSHLLFLAGDGRIDALLVRQKDGGWLGVVPSPGELEEFRESGHLPSRDSIESRPTRYLRRPKAAPGPTGADRIVGRWRLGWVDRAGKPGVHEDEWRLTIEISPSPEGEGRFLASVVDCGEKRAAKVKVILYARLTHLPGDSGDDGRPVYRAELNGAPRGDPVWREDGTWRLGDDRLLSKGATWFRE